DFGGLLFQAFAAHGRFLRARPLTFQLSEQVRVLAVRALDAALRGVALALRGRELLATRGEPRFHFPSVLFAAREVAALLLETLLAFEHAGVRIAAAIDAQPVATDPLARARDDRLVVRQLPTHLQGGRKTLGELYARQQAHDGLGSADHAGQHARGAVGFLVFTRLQQRNPANLQARQDIGDRIDLVHA